jgi:hypothetical protein
VQRVLGRVPLVIGQGSKPIRRIGWCSGGAQGYFEQAIALGVDAYLSGEISSRPSIWQGRAALPTLPPGTMPPNVTVCRRWPNTLAGNWVSPASLSISTTRSD